MPATTAHAAFPGQNGRIAFTGDEAGQMSCDPDAGSADLRTMNPDGTGIHTIGGACTVAWSPSGARLVFDWVDVGIGDGTFALGSANADGSGFTQIGWFSGSLLVPAWSPDGQRIVYRCHGGAGICVVNSDGSGLRTVVPVPLRRKPGLVARRHQDRLQEQLRGPKGNFRRPRRGWPGRGGRLW